jgi:surface carbohydrate biosynthesis protein
MSIFRRPQQAPVVIYPKGKSSDILLEYLDKAQVIVTNPWEGSLNLPTILRMLLSFKFSRFHYLIAYLQLTRAKFVITTTDNDITFYRIKKYLPAVTTIAIQNGLRGNYSSPNSTGFLIEISQEAELACDYILAFGKTMGLEFQKHIKTEFIAVGSIRNNSFTPSSAIQEANQLVYISQLTNRALKPDEQFADFMGNPISYQEFYGAEKQICDYLAKYCVERGLKFLVCGKQNSTFTAEQDFFKPHEVSGRNEPFSSYELLNAAEILVSLDSAIGYEFLSRGNRVVIVGGRFSHHPNKTVREMPDVKFGFPAELPTDGPFWISGLSETDLKERLDSVRSMSGESWTDLIKPYQDLLMRFDPDNQILRKTFSDIGLPTVSGKPA